MTYTKINRIYNDINESINPDPDPGTIDLQSKSIEITENGDSVITADPNYDGLSSVNLSVNVPIPTPYTVPEYDVSKFLFTYAHQQPGSYYFNFNATASSVKKATSSTGECCYIVQFGDTIVLNFGKPPVGAYYTTTSSVTSLSGSYSNNGKFVKYNGVTIINEYIYLYYDKDYVTVERPYNLSIFGKLINLPS